MNIKRINNEWYLYQFSFFPSRESSQLPNSILSVTQFYKCSHPSASLCGRFCEYFIFVLWHLEGPSIPLVIRGV